MSYLILRASESSVNNSTNKSKVTVNMYIHTDSGSWTGYSKPGTITINGSSHSISHDVPYGNGEHWLGSYAVTVAHDSNGRKTCYYSGSFNMSGTSVGYISGSGSIKLTYIPWGYCTLDLVVSESNVDVVSNTSLITAKTYVTADSYIWSSEASGYITIDGTKTTFKDHMNAGSRQLIGTVTKKVTHDADGSKSVGLCTDYYPNTAHQPTSVSKTFVCEKIPRGSFLQDVSDFNFEEGTPISYISNSDTFINKLTIRSDTTIIREDYLVSNNELIKFTSSEMLLIYNELTDGKAVINFDLKTYDGTTQMGETSSKYAVGTMAYNLYCKVNGVFKKGFRLKKINGEWHRMFYFRKVNGKWRK